MSICPFCGDPRGGQAIHSEMRWKIPVIILMFVVAIGVSEMVRLL